MWYVCAICIYDYLFIEKNITSLHIFFRDRTKRLHVNILDYTMQLARPAYVIEKGENMGKNQGRKIKLIWWINATPIGGGARRTTLHSQQIPKEAMPANDHRWLSERMDSRTTKIEEIVQSWKPWSSVPSTVDMRPGGPGSRIRHGGAQVSRP